MTRLKDSETHELNRAEAAEAEVARLTELLKDYAQREFGIRPDGFYADGTPYVVVALTTPEKP